MKRILIILFAMLAMGSMAFAQDFVMSNGAEPTLDPTLFTDVASTNVGLGLFEGLMTYDPKTNKGIPAAAEDFPKISADGITLTFKLRKNATWSDGHPVTAKDFVYAMKRILDPTTGAEYASFPGMVIKGADDFNQGKGSFDNVGIKALDDYTLQYTLVGPAPYAVDMMTHQAFWPVPQWAIEKSGNEWTKPANIVTNGPYTLKEWKPQEYVLLQKNPKYWDAKNVKLNTIKITSSDNDKTNYNDFKAGNTDWMHGIAADLIDEIKLRKDYQVAPQWGTYYYVFNLTKKPLDDVRVRKALAAAIDKKTLVEKITKGGQVATDSWVPPNAGYVSQKGIGYNVEQAKKLLADAGFPGGKGFPTLTVIYNTNQGHQKIAEYIQQQWKANLGIDVTLKNQEFKTFLDLRDKQHDFEIARDGWIGDYLDPNTFLDMMMTGNGNNAGLYANPEFDKLVKDAGLQKGAERMKTLQKAEALYLTRDQAQIPIYFYVNQDLINTAKWGGWYSTPMGFHPFKFLYKK